MINNKKNTRFINSRNTNMLQYGNKEMEIIIIKTKRKYQRVVFCIASYFDIRGETGDWREIIYVTKTLLTDLSE